MLHLHYRQSFQEQLQLTNRKLDGQFAAVSQAAMILYIKTDWRIWMNKEQQGFLEQLAQRIPRLFEAIAQGNQKSEYIIGVRRIGTRHVRLKLVAEVVDPGANPLATHGQMRPITVSVRSEVIDPADDSDCGTGGGEVPPSQTSSPATRRRQRERPRRR